VQFDEDKNNLELTDCQLLKSCEIILKFLNQNNFCEIATIVSGYNKSSHDKRKWTKFASLT